jgi:hypothetical protein
MLLRAVVPALVLVVLAACSASDSFGPGGRIEASDQELANISIALLDARDRIAPELHTTEIIPLLQNRLSMLSEYLLARRFKPTSDTLLEARKLLTDSETIAPPEDAADRAAIHLALDQVDLLLHR